MGKLSLTIKILLAITIGSFLGILLGPLCSIFEPIEKSFVMFTQMVVILYIPTSIIHGLGSTRPNIAKQLLKKGGGFLLFIWGIVFISVYLLKMLFPSSNIILSGTGIHSTFEQNFLNYVVPQNPIYDLVNNIVPAVAIFAIIIGIALMHLSNKEPLISILERINGTLENILKGITIVSPFGVLAIFANFIGNIRLTDLKGYEIYLVPMVLIAVILTFWILPALVISCTPLKYREVIQDIRAACFLPFIIGSPSIAIPFLNKTVQHYSERFNIKEKDIESTSQMIVPIAYTFTQVGNLFLLFFIMFISYYFHHQLGGFDEGLVSFLTLVMSFGGPELAVNSISFLIEKLGFPETSMSVYNDTSIIAQNFQILISVSCMVVFVILLLLGYYKRLIFNASTFFRHFFLFFFILVMTVFTSKYFISEFSPIQNTSMQYSMETALPNTPKGTIYKEGEKVPYSSDRLSEPDTLKRIYNTKELYIGYHPNLPPFSYFNEKEELVGFTIAFAYKLASSMNVKPVFIPFQYDELGKDIENNQFDIGMSPILLSEATVQNLNFPDSYLKTPNVLIVPKNRKEEFKNFYNLQKNPYVSIGYLGFYKEVLDRILPNAQAYSVESIRNIESDLTEGHIDGMLWTLEQAIDYCRSHPDYIVMRYGDIAKSSSLAFPVKYDAFAFIFFLNRWLAIQESIGFKKKQYDYWMLGHPPQQEEPRASLIRNVFHWIK